jgi:hypothetical protein
MDKNIIDMTLENMKFSYSSVSSFNTCAYGFYLSYIQYAERTGNWFSDFGLLMHETLERYFKGELEIMELAGFYEENYPKMVTSDAPPYPAGIADRYYADGLRFFEEFDFNKDDYEVVFVEDIIETTHNDIKLVVKPDLVLKDKKTGEYLLLDYKTSNPFSKDGKPDKKKMADYRKQMYLYAYFINHNRDYKISKIRLWFVRVNKFDEFDYVEEDAGDVVNWFFNGILNIKFEEEFPPCDTTKNKFFCMNLCGVSAFCPYKP